MTQRKDAKNDPYVKQQRGPRENKINFYSSRFEPYEQTFKTLLQRQEELKQLTDEEEIKKKTEKIKELQGILARTEAGYTAHELEQVQELKKRLLLRR